MTFREWIKVYEEGKYQDNVKELKRQIDSKLVVLACMFNEEEFLFKGEKKLEGYRKGDLNQKEIEFIELILKIFPAKVKDEMNILSQIDMSDWTNVSFESKKRLWELIMDIRGLEKWWYLNGDLEKFRNMLLCPIEYKMKSKIDGIYQIAIQLHETLDGNEKYEKELKAAEKDIDALYKSICKIEKKLIENNNDENEMVKMLEAHIAE